MAAIARRWYVAQQLKTVLATSRNCKIAPAMRTKITLSSGAVVDEPEKMTFPLSRVILTVLPGLYLGATISKEGAAFLEENDIFVPDDDDDE